MTIKPLWLTDKYYRKSGVNGTVVLMNNLLLGWLDNQERLKPKPCSLGQYVLLNVALFHNSN